MTLTTRERLLQFTIMHAYLIINGTAETRQSKLDALCISWHVSPIDRHTLMTDGTSIGIEETRAFKKQLIMRPVTSPVIVGVIPAFERLTIIAQQSLLKILEEPPPHCTIVLLGTNTSSLLSTILSRCQIISIQNSTDLTSIQDTQAWLQTLTHIQHMSYGQRIAFTDTIGNTHDQALVWIEQAIVNTHRLLIRNIRDEMKTPINIVHFLRSLLRGKHYLEANVNPKLSVDSVLFSLLVDKSGGLV